MKNNSTNKKQNILVIDDELSMRELLEIMLSSQGYNVICASSGSSAIKLINENIFDLLLCDIRLGDISGIEVLKAAKNRKQNTIVIMISAYATTQIAVEAMNNGAYDYVPKPFDNNELKLTIANALKLKTLEHEKKVITDELKKNIHFNHLVGNSSKLLHICNLIEQVAKTKTNILITGESGTGKELIAKSIHEQSDRRDKPFVTINCGSIPDTLLESELFGHIKGSFTGASQDKKGLFEIADNGTLLLDEIGETSQNIQVKLLRAVQEKKIKPVGSTQDIEIDIRIISATNKNLEEEIIEKRFREDLFYRLNVIEIKVPPLRERKNDILILSQHFLEKYSTEMNKKVSKISSYAIELLKKYDFPGNIRELENLIERSVALSSTNILLPDSLALSFHKKRISQKKDNSLINLDKVPDGIMLDDIIAEIEKNYLAKALECSGGNKQQAAKLLGINLRSLRYRLEKANL